jgi:hypothetical protein
MFFILKQKARIVSCLSQYNSIIQQPNHPALRLSADTKTN